MKGTKEFYEVQQAFESFVNGMSCNVYFGALANEDTRAKKEEKHFYNHGKLNEAFIMFMSGYSLGRQQYM